MNRISRWIAVVLLGTTVVLTAADGFDQTHARFAGVLKKHVKDALVDYRALKADPAELDAYLEELAAVNPETFHSWTPNEQLALLLNLYNAQTLRMIIDHHPLTSIRKIGFLPGAAWRIPNVRFGGELLTLDQLEHTVIRARYDEPRIHFALVCAAIGCPPLREEPYVAATLDRQLDDQARRFLADTTKNRFDAGPGVLRLSPIFKWYEEDFTRPAGSLVRYVIPFFPDSTTAAVKDAGEVTVEFTEYDWALNERTR